MNNPLPRKGYARIYVKSEEDIEVVEGILRDNSEFEWSYYPKGLVAVFNGDLQLIYTGKYEDTCMDKLAFECMKRGIWIQVFKSNSQNEETVWRYTSEIKKGLPPEERYD